MRIENRDTRRRLDATARAIEAQLRMLRPLPAAPKRQRKDREAAPDTRRRRSQ